MYTVKYLFSGENLQNKAINLVELKNKFPSIIEKIQINEHFFFFKLKEKYQHFPETNKI